VSLTACNDFDEKAMQFDNVAYLDVASVKNYEPMTFNNTVTEQQKTFSVVLTYPSADDVTAAVSVDPSLVAVYNEQNETSWEMLPATHYSLSAGTVTVKAGQTVSEQVTLSFKGLDGLEIDKTYLCPVSISSASIELMESSSTIFYIVKRSSAITTAASLRDNWINFPTLDADTPSSHIFNGLSAVTYEALIYVDDFSKNAEISSVVGVEQYLLLRIGDASFPRQQLQFDGSGVGFGKFPAKDDTKLISAGEWYHVAATYDQATSLACIYVNGKLQSQGVDMGTNNKPINLAMRALYAMYAKDPENSTYSDYAGYSEAYQFFVGRSYDNNRPLNGDIAEVRVWSVARSAEDIWASMYDVDPKTPGLLGYWKFNEGTGNVIIDRTGNGNDGVAQNPLVWPTGIEIPQINKE
jgi:hypothetical protein